MTQDAIVMRVLDGGWAEVRVERGTACGGNCPSCGGCSYKNVMKTRAVNKISAGVGDRVTLETRTSKILGLAALVYFVPLLVFFAGYTLAAVLRLPETGSMLVSIGGLILGALGVAWRERNRKRDVTFEIVAIQ